MMKSCFYVSLLAAMLEISFAEDITPAWVLPETFPTQSEQTVIGACSHLQSPVPCVIKKEVPDGYPADSENYVYCVLIYAPDTDSASNLLQECYLLGSYPTLDAALDALTSLKDSRKPTLNSVRKKPRQYRLLPPEGDISLFTKEELERLNRFTMEFNCEIDYLPGILAH